MEQRGRKGGAIILAIAAIAAVLWLLRGKGPPPPGTGPATPAGSVFSVDVAQRARTAMRRGRAAMGSHLLLKTVGSTVTVTVVWTAATKSSTGQPIPWNYGIDWQYIHRPTGTNIRGGFFPISNKPNGTYTFSTSPLVLTAPFSGKDWLVSITLKADTSSPIGTPNNDVGEITGIVIASAQHLNAFRVA